MTEETAKSPFLSGESFDELSVRRKAEPVATGAGALVSREAIAGDRFVSGNCIRCWMKAALFVFEQQYVSLCPKCATERIEHMASEGGELPPTVVWLHFETRKETRGQERQEREALSVKLDDFLRCHRCGRTVQVKDAASVSVPSETVAVTE